MLSMRQEWCNRLRAVHAKVRAGGDAVAAARPDLRAAHHQPVVSSSDCFSTRSGSSSGRKALMRSFSLPFGTRHIT
jgi:hypothetical protein